MFQTSRGHRCRPFFLCACFHFVARRIHRFHCVSTFADFFLLPPSTATVFPATNLAYETSPCDSEGGGASCSFIACLSHLTIDHASFSRRTPFLLLIETPPTRGRSVRFFHSLPKKLFAHLICLLGCLWPLSVSQVSGRCISTI